MAKPLPPKLCPEAMNAASHAVPRGRHWHLSASAPIYAVLLLGAGALWPSTLSLVRYWSAVHEYQHGFLIAVAVLAWLFAIRHELAACEWRARPELALALVPLVFVWLVAFLGNSEFGHQLLLPPIVWLMASVAFGYRVGKLLIAPLAYFYFALPLWDYAVPVLQRITVFATEWGLKIVGVPAKIVGTHVTIPEGTFQIAEGCSGKRYFMVALALATLAGVVTRLSARRLLILLAWAAGLALLFNWIRVLIIIYAGHVSYMQHYLVAVEHIRFGTGIFLVLLAAILFVTRCLSLARDAEREAIAAPATPRRQNRVSMLAVGGVALLAAIPLSITALHPSRAGYLSKLGDLPVIADSWQGPLPADPGWRPSFDGNDSEIRAAYQSEPGKMVEMYANLYGKQERGRELVFHLNSVLSPQWQSSLRHPETSFLAAVDNVRGRVPVRLTASTPAGEHWAVAYVYRVGGHATGSPLFAQLLYGAMALTRTAPAGVIAWAVRCEPDCDAAHQLIADLWEARGREFLALIPER